ncbi:MAG TPA: hypothetical protein VL769_03570 [Acidimicrobiia bacterium]|nr:hypothetical protein [Acidimicrobiia bacterium]
MSTMPYWMNKTPEMVAMDRWFGGPDLVTRYNNAINRINAAKQNGTLPGTSDALDNELPGGSADAFKHFGKDWLNPNNPSSGGDYWPHVPTFTIIPWLRTGLLRAAQKGLGTVELASFGASPSEIQDLFRPERDWSGLTDADLQGVLPLVTTWVCTSPPGTGTIQVDVIRGPSVVELIISTPQPAIMQSRLFAEVRDLIDQQWVIIHGGPDVIDLVDHDDYEIAGA